MSPLQQVDDLLFLAAQLLERLTHEDPDTGEFQRPEGEMAHAALKTVEGARRLVERAKREQVCVPTAGLRVVSPPGATGDA